MPTPADGRVQAVVSETEQDCTRHLQCARHDLGSGTAGVAGVARGPGHPGSSCPGQVAAPGKLPREGWLPVLHNATTLSLLFRAQ